MNKFLQLRLKFKPRLKFGLRLANGMQQFPTSNLNFVCSAGPWTIFAPTNAAFMNMSMKELEELITNPKKLFKLVLNHIINKYVNWTDKKGE